MTAITPGRLARHTPPGPQGRYAALIDIAEDLLLAHLDDQGIFEHLVFKGGTALRKLYAGNAGRFSTDLDLRARRPERTACTDAAGLCAESTRRTQFPGLSFHETFHATGSDGA